MSRSGVQFAFNIQSINNLWANIHQFSLSSCHISEHVYKLTKSILKSPPSLRAMLIIHNKIFNGSESKLKEKINEILLNWRNGKKIFLFRRPFESPAFYMLSGINGRVYVDNIMLSKSDFILAYNFAHECQHIFSREQEIPYSPLEITKSNEIFKFLNVLNDGLPMESGHLFWGMLFGKAGIMEDDITTHIEEINNPHFWKFLKDDFPIVPVETWNDVEELNENAYMPYSLSNFNELNPMKKWKSYRY